MGATGFDPKVSLDDPEALTKIRRELKDAGSDRIWYIADAFRAGLSVDGVFNLTNVDRWFLVQIEELVRLEEQVAEAGINGLNKAFLRTLKRKGFADARLAKLAGVAERNSQAAPQPRPASGVQACGYLRGGIRHRHRLHVLHL